MTPGPKALEAILHRCGIRLDRTQIGMIWRYHERLRAANAELNLTRIHNFENMVLKHYVDSLLVLRFVELAVAVDRYGLGPGFAGDPAEDCPTGGADDPGRAAGGTGGVPPRGLRAARAGGNRGLSPTNSGRIIPNRLPE